jgi:hypothetical protein
MIARWSSTRKTRVPEVITARPFSETQRWIELGLPRADTKLVLFTARGQADDRRNPFGLSTS